MAYRWFIGILNYQRVLCLHIRRTGIWSGVFASAGSIVIIVNLIKIEKITIESSKETDGQITFINRMGSLKKP